MQAGGGGRSLFSRLRNVAGARGTPGSPGSHSALVSAQLKNRGWKRRRGGRVARVYIRRLVIGGPSRRPGFARAVFARRTWPRYFKAARAGSGSAARLAALPAEEIARFAPRLRTELEPAILRMDGEVVLILEGFVWFALD